MHKEAEFSVFSIFMKLFRLFLPNRQTSPFWIRQQVAFGDLNIDLNKQQLKWLRNDLDKLLNFFQSVFIYVPKMPSSKERWIPPPLVRRRKLFDMRDERWVCIYYSAYPFRRAKEINRTISWKQDNLRLLSVAEALQICWRNCETHVGGPGIKTYWVSLVVPDHTHQSRRVKVGTCLGYGKRPGYNKIETIRGKLIGVRHTG